MQERREEVNVVRQRGRAQSTQIEGYQIAGLQTHTITLTHPHTGLFSY